MLVPDDLDEAGHVAGARVLAGRRHDGPEDVEAIRLGGVRKRIVERDDLSLIGRDRPEVGPDLRVECCKVVVMTGRMISSQEARPSIGIRTVVCARRALAGRAIS
jgi:hypothetical protein